MANRVKRNSLQSCFAAIAAGFSLAVAEAAEPPSIDPIAAARRDYEAIKATEAESNLRAPAQIRQRMPSVELAPEGPTVTTPIQRARQTEAIGAKAGATKSKNWLLDAMGERDSAVEMSGRQGSLKLVGDAEKLDSESLLSESGTRGEARKTAHDFETMASKSNSRTPIANPLDDYMSTWMTARDFELLQTKPASGGRGSLAPDLLSRPNSFPSTMVPGVHSPTSDNESPFRLLEPALNANSVNPYLKELAVAPSLTPVQTHTQTNSIVPTSLLPPLQTVPPPLEQPNDTSGKQLTDERWKPQDDARYFRQLKRF